MASTHQRVQITKNGRDNVMLLAAADLESLEATLELLSDRVGGEGTGLPRSAILAR